MNKKYIEITIIRSPHNSNGVLDRILHSINTYLLRNRGAVSDFNLIKDIADRNSDALDEEINTLLPIPLYLGLMGTMLGIVIGLFSMPGIDKLLGDEFTPNSGVEVVATGRTAVIVREKPARTYEVQYPDGTLETLPVKSLRQKSGIEILLGGVKIAMIASFIGLLLTVIASGYFYKGAKTRAESLKNDFFTFIQTELLPVLSNSTASVVRTFEKVIQSFTKDFKSSTSDFVASVDGVGMVAGDFREMIGELRKINLVQLTEMNVSLLKKLKVSAGEFDKFNGYLEGVNEFTRNAMELNYGISKQLERTRDIEKIAGVIEENVYMNRGVMDFLRSDLNQMETRKQVMTNAIIDVTTNMDKAVEEMGKFIQDRISQLKTDAIDIDKYFSEMFTEISSKFSRLFEEERGNFGDLKKLNDVAALLAELKDISGKQNGQIEALTASIRQLAFAQPQHHVTTNPHPVSTQVTPPPSPWSSLPKPVAYITIACLSSGAAIGTGFIVFKLIDWINLLL